MAIRTVAGIIDEYGFATINEETDLALAEQSIASNLKLVEILAKGDPGNENLFRLLSMAYTSYSLGFVEDDSLERARMLYLRGRDYGLRVLKENHRFAASLTKNIDEFRAALRTLSKNDVPTVFWTAAAWGGYINTTLTEPAALADIPRVEAMMQHVAEQDSSFFFGGAHIFLGTIYGGRPRLLGGDPEKARQHFEQALRIGNGKFLLTHVYYARSYAVQVQDSELFDRLLTTVDTTSVDILPEVRLTNAIAKKKAQFLRSRMSIYF